jgi:hypothetical protein
MRTAGRPLFDTRCRLLLQVLAPTAVTYQSGLLGFGAAATLFSAVGFSVLPTGLCWCAWASQPGG